MNTIKTKLEHAWREGFFYNLRYGNFVQDQYEELKKDFNNIILEDINYSDKRLISLLWVIPIFISWQEERLEKKGVMKATFSEISDFFYTQCERILGLP